MAPQLGMGTFRIWQDGKAEAAYAIADTNAGKEVWALRKNYWVNPGASNPNSTINLQCFPSGYPATCAGMRDYLTSIFQNYRDFDIREHTVKDCVYALEERSA